MSKVTVFKFNIDSSCDSNNIRLIIEKYLNECNFGYNNEEQCFMYGPIGNSNLCRSFKYEIIENQLVIKACLFNILSTMKSCIHSNINTFMIGKEYYNDLKEYLFKDLENYNVKLISTGAEKVKDGSGNILMKMMLFTMLPSIIIIAIITLFVYLSSH